MLNNILILSLPKDRRRRFMDFKMKNIGIDNYTYYDAIDGSKLPQYKDYTNYCKKHSKKILIGEHGAYGCLMSYRKLFAEQKESCLVLEDDVYFHKNFKNMLEELYVEKIFDRYDLVYFGYNNYRLSTEQLQYINQKEKIIPVEKDYKFITCGTYAIWYSYKAICLLNNVLKNIQYDFIKPIDNIVWSVSRKLKSGIINPPLCISEIRDSNIRMPRNIKSFYETRLVNLKDYEGVSDYPKWMIH